MSNGDEYDYPRMVLDALRQVPRTVLRQLAWSGGPLPEPHQLYLTFRTGHPEVAMADYLRDSYPQEMTIVLKTQFRDLEVDDQGFSVTLFFSSVAQTLYVPFAALTAFVDPGVEFGLRFDGLPAGAPPGEEAAGEDLDEPSAGTPAAGTPSAEQPRAAGDNVVSIDRFRRSS